MGKISTQIEETSEDLDSTNAQNSDLLVNAKLQTGSQIRIIQRRSADGSQRPKDIFEAAAAGDLDSVKYFITEQQVSVDIRAPGSNETPIFKAVQGGHLSVIEYLINTGATINNTDKWGYHCLLWAVDQNKADVDIIKLLVSSGADVNLKEKKKGYSALHWAAFHDNLEIVKYLIEQGADVRASANGGETPIELAAQNGALNVVDFLIEDQNVPFDIFTAAAKGYTETVKYFIEKKGKRVDSADTSGWSALHRATFNGHLETVQFLVEEKGANVNVRNKQNQIPLTPLHAAAQKGYSEIARFLVEKGANFNVRDLNGRSPLYWAADTGHLEIVKYLVDDKKANFLQRDNYDNTLLHAIAYNGHLNVLKYLIEEKKMDANLKNGEGYTALSESLQVNKVPIYQYLIRVKGIDVKSANIHGDTALHFAAQKGYLEIVKTLVSKGADVNAKQRDGRTPLYWAADGTATSTGRLNVVRYFIDEKKCDPFQRDNYGNTLLHAAEWNGSLDVVKYLVEEKKIDVNVKDNDGNTPLSEALQRGKTAIVQYLQSKGAQRRRRSADSNRIRRQVDDDRPTAGLSTDGQATSSASKATFLLGGTIDLVRNSVSHLTLPSAGAISSMMSRRDGTNPLVGGILVLFDFAARKFTGNNYKQPVHESLLSLNELIAQRFDYNAIAAIENTYGGDFCPRNSAEETFGDEL